MLGWTIWLCLIGAGVIICLRKEWHLAIKVVAAVTTFARLTALRQRRCSGLHQDR